MSDPRPPAPKKWIIATKIILLIGLSVVLGWDVVVANNPWRGDTVSELTLWAVLRSLTLSVALGFVAGHLTWPATKRRPVWVVLVSGGVLLGLCVTLDVLTLLGKISWSPLNFVRAWPPVSFLPSYVLGRVLWPQARA